MRFLRIILYVTTPLVIIYFSLAYYVDQQLAKKDFSDSYNDCHKVWTARGLYGDGIDQNSIESISTAFEQGAMGVEVDIRYDIELNDFIVSHDYPYNKKNGKILPLSELFDATGDDHYFWLDYKGLRRLDESQTREAIQRLFAISAKNGLSQRIYVEGEAPVNIFRYRKAGFHTIYDTHPLSDSNFFTPFVITLYKMIFYFGDHSVMGMEYGEIDNPVYGTTTRKLLSNVPVFLYHLPVSEALVDEMLALEKVRAFIVGNNQSVNFHHKNNCSLN